MQNISRFPEIPFRMSAYISYVDDIRVNEKICAGIYSFQGRHLLPMESGVLRRLQQEELNTLSDGILTDLVNNDMLLPEGIDEQQLTADMLQQVREKLTLLIDQPVASISWTLLRQIILHYHIKSLSFILLSDDSTATAASIISAIRGELSGLQLSITKTKYFTLRSGREGMQLKELVEEKNSWQEANVSHLPTVHPPQGSFSIRAIEQVSISCSEYTWIKELPVSGLVTDPASMHGLLPGMIIPRCRNCNALVACGGYVGHSSIHCPSAITNLKKSVEQKLYTPDQQSGGIPGINNSLALSNEIAGQFEKVIADNTNVQEKLMICYLVKEYNKGFLLSRNGHYTLAALKFRQTDAIAAIHAQEGFCYDYASAIAASTSSYLAYREGSPEMATAIVDAGIHAGIKLLTYRSSAVMILFISQLLMNKARVLLAAEKLNAWKEVTLQNIHFLINTKLPETYGIVSASQFNDLTPHLKDGMLLEIINQVLKLNIKNRNFQIGEALINSIEIEAHAEGLPRQLLAWVNLCMATHRQDEFFLQQHLQDFMEEQNEVNDISTLKAYLRVQIKKTGMINQFK